MKHRYFSITRQCTASLFLVICGLVLISTPAKAANYTFHPIYDRAAIEQARANIVSIGEACPAVENLWNIRENGQSTTVFKVACSNGREYQLTITGGKLYVKPWKGNLLGQ